MNDLFHLNVPALALVVRALVVYVAVLLLLRMAGKRQLGQMTPTEFVAVLLISNAVQNAMNGGDNSLSGGLLLAVVLVFSSWLISVLTFHYARFSKIFEGTPTLLVHKGKSVAKNLARERITPSELRSLLRRQGIHRVEDVHSAILEPSGILSVVRVDEAPAARGDADLPGNDSY
ncbi:MAG: DUF421 domain-containing protein [Deltaproteobacteria bacterium]|nr:DUF421 domain-containing protein [Deltaproteobacteria bacterium]